MQYQNRIGAYAIIERNIDNKIAMTKVNDKDSDGIFEIPEYVEQIGEYSNPY